MMKKFLVSGLLATSIGLTAVSSAFAADGSGKEGRMGHPHMIPLAGDVVSLTSSSLTMTIADPKDHAMVKEALDKMGLSSGEQVTVTISSETKLIEDAKDVSLSDFSVGERIFVVGKVDGNTIDAKLVANKLPRPLMMKGHGRMGGEVTAIDTSSNTITVTGRDGESHTIVYGTDTKFYVDGEVKTENDLSIGDTIKVKARIDKNLKQLVAQTITVVQANQ